VSGFEAVFPAEPFGETFPAVPFGEPGRLAVFRARAMGITTKPADMASLRGPICAVKGAALHTVIEIP